MGFLKQLNSKKTLRIAQFVLFTFIFIGSTLAAVIHAQSPEVKVQIEGMNATERSGGANLQTTVGFTPRYKKTGTSNPCPAQPPATTQVVGGGGVLPSVAAQIFMNVSSVPDCSSVTTSMGPNGQTLYTYNTTTGAQEVLANYTARMLKDPPASSTEYVAYVYNSFKHPFVEPAYAQGLGFSSLSPVLELWRAMRNLAYFFFVVIFIVIGFMIMFRSKIGGKAAVTVQQALPKIIVSLLLVTFSYAIAGLMIDIMYLLIYLMIGIFAREGTIGLSAVDLSKIAFEGNIFANAYNLFKEDVIGSVAGALGNIATATLELDPNTLGGQLVQGVSNIVFTLVIAIALLVSVFRIFFALLKAYVGIFFSVIFGPIQLLLGALPGQDTFGSWLKGLFENLLVFPILTLLIILAHFFVKSSFSEQGALGFSPPQLTSNQGATGFAVFSGLIPLGVILAMPEVLKLAQGAMKGQLGVSFEDLQKNLNAGRAGAKRVALAPVNIAAGGAIGYVGARKLAKGKPYQNMAGIAGMLGGGLVGGITQAPTTLAGNAVRSIGRVSGEVVTRLGVQDYQRRIKAAKAHRDTKESQAATEAAGRPPETPPNTQANFGANKSLGKSKTTFE